MRAWQACGSGLACWRRGCPSWPPTIARRRRIGQAPGADLNDIYAFRDPGDPDTLILVLTVNPLSDPDFAGSYAFSPRVLYRLAIDNTGDAVFEHNIDVVFSGPSAPGVQRFRARFPDVGVVAGDATPPSTPDDPVIVDGPRAAAFRSSPGHGMTRSSLTRSASTASPPPAIRISSAASTASRISTSRRSWWRCRSIS